jgi:hypothetical protein
MADPYETLGVSPTASQAEVHSAYLWLARKFHPDANGGDQRSLRWFQEIERAHALIQAQRAQQVEGPLAPSVRAPATPATEVERRQPVPPRHQRPPPAGGGLLSRVIGVGIVMAASSCFHTCGEACRVSPAGVSSPK